MNSQMTVGKKLMLAFAGLAFLLVVLSLTFLNAVGSLKESFDTAVDKTAQKISLAGSLDAAESDMLAWQRAVLLNMFVKNNAEEESAKRRFNDAVEEANRSLAAIRPLLVDEEGRRISDATKSGLDEWLVAVTEWTRIGDAGDPAAAVAYARQHTVPICDALR